jgi:hypothetical protein
MSEEKLKIGLPDQGIIRYYVYSFLELLPTTVDIVPYNDHIQISSYNIVKNYKEAFEIISQRISKVKDKYKYKPLIPLSGNDEKIIKKAKKELGLSEAADIDEMFQEYVRKLENRQYSIFDMNNSLYPFAIGTYSLPSIFNIEFYGYTRGAYFDGRHKIGYSASLHMLMILLAGYINARCLRFRMGMENITVLVFPPSSSEIRGFLIPKIKEIRIPLQDLIEEEANKQNLPAIYPVEALILWLLINLPEEAVKNVNLYLIAISEPKGVNPASPIADFFIPLRTLYYLMEDLLEVIKFKEKFYRKEVKEVKGYKDRLNDDLLIPALKYGIITQRKKADLPYIEEALRYVKLLFLACQKGRITERIELLNLSARRYLLLKETERVSEANLSLFVSELARALVEKA